MLHYGLLLGQWWGVVEESKGSLCNVAFALPGEGFLYDVPPLLLVPARLPVSLQHGLPRPQHNEHMSSGWQHWWR